MEHHECGRAARDCHECRVRPVLYKLYAFYLLSGHPGMIRTRLDVKTDSHVQERSLILRGPTLDL